MTTTTDLAREAAGWFQRITRPGEPTKIATLKDGAPEWVRELIYAAHGGDGGYLPDDWTYQATWDALEHLADNDGPDDDHDFADNRTDTYTIDRLEWFRTYPRAVDYVNQARSDFGPGADVTDEIGTGQYLALSDLYQTVRSCLETLAEEDDDNE
jgi:hypothetical protein